MADGFKDFARFINDLMSRVEKVGDALDNASDSSDPMKTVGKDLDLDLNGKLRPASIPLMDKGVAEQAMQNRMLVEKAKDAGVLADALHEYIVNGKTDVTE